MTVCKIAILEMNSSSNLFYIYFYNIFLSSPETPILVWGHGLINNLKFKQYSDIKIKPLL